MRIRHLLLLGLVFTGFLTAPADAQIGRLVKKATKSATAAVMPFTPAPAPEFNDEVLEITDVRYRQLESGLRAEIAEAKLIEKEEAEREKNKAAQDSADAAAERQFQEATRKYEADLKVWEAKRADHEKLVEAHDRKVAVYEKCLEDIEEANLKDAEVAEKLLEEGKVMESNAVAQRILKRIQSCGAIPMGPVLSDMPPAPQAPTQTGPGAPSYQRIRAKGEAASGLKERPYAIMRERWLNFCQSDGKPSMGFSEEEFTVLSANQKACGDLVKSLSQAKIL